MADPNVKIVLTLDDKAAGGLNASARNIERVGQAAGQASAGAERLADAIKRVGHYGAGLVGLTGLESIATGIVRAADGFTNLTSKLQLVSSSTSALNRNLEETFGIAQRTRQSWEGTAEIYGKLARVTSDLGISQKQLAGVVETVNQAILVSGGSAQSAQAALVQLGQGLASGTLRGEELNSVMEQTPRLAQALADGLGVGIGQLRAMGEAGELTGERVVGALQKAAASVSADFGKMVPTVAGAWQQISNAALQYVGAADKAVGASSGIANAMSSIAGNFTTFATAIEATAVALGVLTGGKILAAVAAKKQLAAASLQAAAAEQASAAAAVRSAEANTILIGSTTALTAAKQRLAAANAAVAASAPVGVIAALGGPIGAAVTAATALAGVLAVVATNAKSSGDALRNDIAADTEELVGSLQKQIDKIRERNRLLGMGVDAPDALAERSAATRSRNATLQAQIDALERQGISPDTRIAERNAASIAVMKAQIEENNRALDTAIAKQKELNEAQDQFGKGDPSKRLDTYFDKFGASARKAAADVANLDKATQQAFTDAQSLPVDRRSSAMAEIAANHTQRLAEIDKKAGAEAAAEAKRLAAEAAQVIKAQYAQRLEGLQQSLKAEEQAIALSLARREIDERESIASVLRFRQQNALKELDTLRQQYGDTADPSARADLLGKIQKAATEYSEAAGVAALATAKLDNELHKLRDTALGDEWKKVFDLEAENEKLREEYKTLGMTTEQLAKYRDEKLRAAAVGDREFADALDEAVRNIDMEAEGAREAAAYYRELAQAKREAAGKLDEQAQLTFDATHRRKAVDEWQKFSDDIEQALTDSLYRSFESGKNFGETFKDSLANTFKSMILKVAVQAIVNPVMGAVQGALGIGGQGGVGGATGAVGTGAKMLSAGGSIAGLMGANAIAGTSGAGLYGAFATSTIGQSIGLSALTPGLMGPTTSGFALGSASGGATLTSVGAALPYIGATIAIGSLLGGWFGGKKKEPNIGIGSRAPWAEGSGYDGHLAAGQYNYVGSPFSIFRAQAQHTDDREGIQQAIVKNFLQPVAQLDALIAAQLDKVEIKEIQQVLDKWSTGYGENTDFSKNFTERVGKISDVIGGYADEMFDAFAEDMKDGYILLTTALSVEGDKTFEAVLKQLLAGTDSIAEAYAKDGESGVQAAARLVQSIKQVNSAFGDLGYSLIEITAVGTKAAADLIDAFGGADQFTADISAYFNAFYSEQEKFDIATKKFTESFKNAGLGFVPESMADYRAYADALAEAGDPELYAAIIKLAPAFAQLTQMADALGSAVSEAARQSADLRERLLAQYRPMDANAAAAAVNGVFPILDPAALLGASAAQLDVMLGNLVESFDPTTQAGQDAIGALDGLSAAIGVLMDAANTAADDALSNALTTNDLKLRLYTAQGRDDYVQTVTRALEIANAATQEHKDLLQQIFDAEDAAKITAETQVSAAQAWQDATNEVQRAYDKERTAIESRRDAFVDIAKGLSEFRSGLLSAFGQLSPEALLAETGKRYTQTLAKAKLGDIDAGHALTGMAGEYLKAAQEYYASGPAYQSILESVDAGLGDVQSVAERQISLAEDQLTALRDQVRGILDLNDTVMSLSDAIDDWKAKTLKASEVGVTDATDALTNYTATAAEVAAQAMTGSISLNDERWWDSVNGYSGEKMFHASAGGTGIWDADAIDVARWAATARNVQGQQFSGADVTALIDKLSAMLVELQAANDQRGATATAQLEQLEALKTEVQAQVTALKRAA